MKKIMVITGTPHDKRYKIALNIVNALEIYLEDGGELVEWYREGHSFLPQRAMRVRSTFHGRGSSRPYVWHDWQYFSNATSDEVAKTQIAHSFLCFESEWFHPILCELFALADRDMTDCIVTCDEHGCFDSNDYNTKPATHGWFSDNGALE